MNTNSLKATSSLLEMSISEMQIFNGGKKYMQTGLNELINIRNHFANQATSMGTFMWNHYNSEVINHRAGLKAQGSK